MGQLKVGEELLFEKFRIIDCLKKDSFTSVCLAYHVYLEKKIILKTLDTSGLDDNSILERFKREAKILASLDHPNIIKVLDFGTYNEFFYISFEYFDSRNLRKVLVENNLKADQKKDLFIQLLKGLSAAHSHKVIHRDIKPENILVNSAYELKIADFGLAMLMNETNVTYQYSIVGTPGYMSPEQIQGERLSQLSDLFSTGVVAFELFTSVHPFMGHDVNETINNILSKDESSLTETVRTAPEELRPVIMKLLSKNSSARYGSASEVLEVLGEKDAEQKTVKIEQPAAGKKTGKISRLIIPLVVILAAVMIYWVLKGKVPDGNRKFVPADSISGSALKNTDTITIAVNQPAAAEDKQEEKNEEKDEKLTAEVNSPGKTVSPAKSGSYEAGSGRVRIECSPWAAVYIDSKKYDTTPLKSPITLTTGEHSLVLIHPEYTPYSTRIHIRKDMLTTVKVNLDTLMGYLNCKAYPWGEIYINGYFRGQTPLRRPVMLAPGSYTLTIKNPSYPDFIDYIRIRKRDTLIYKMNFEALNKKK